MDATLPLSPGGGTAPCIGRHRKKNSLVGFDPLLEDGNENRKERSAVAGAEVSSLQVLLAPSLGGSTAAPPPPGMRTPPLQQKQPPQQQQQQQSASSGAVVTPQRLARELRELATEIENKTPPPAAPPLPTTAAPAFRSSPSLSPLDNSTSEKMGNTTPGASSGTTTPSRRLRKRLGSLGLVGKGSPSSNNNNNTASTGSTKLQLPWGKKKGDQPQQTKDDRRGRKAQSLASSDYADILNNAELAAKLTQSAGTKAGAGSFSAGTAAGVSGDHPRSSFSSPMMQELWYTTSGSDPAAGLVLPSLAKPRPTSFLTGKEAGLFRTSEQDATGWQLLIPPKSDVEVCAKVSQFLDTYRSEECCLDLGDLVGFSRFELSQFATGNSSLTQQQGQKPVADLHRPVVEALLDCGADILAVKGHYMSGDVHDDPNSRRELLVLERQQQLLCVMRGTKADEQQLHGKLFGGAGNNNSIVINKQTTAPTTERNVVQLKENDDVEVYADKLPALGELEKAAFELLDQLAEDNPFCDVAFGGHSFGASIAILAAYRYAFARPELRVRALVTGCPARIGLDSFRMSAHSLPNLNVFRVELGWNNISSNSKHPIVGHTIRINAAAAVSPKNNSNNAAATAPELLKAYKFGDHDTNEQGTAPAPAAAAASVRSLFSGVGKRGDRSAAPLSDYVSALEGIPADKWVRDYYNQNGAGVVGTNNEARQMV